MHYVDSVTGATYPLAEPRWRGDSGGHVNLGPAPGLKRRDIDSSIHSLWRYRKALLDEVGRRLHAPLQADDRTLGAWLDRVGESRGASQKFTRLWRNFEVQPGSGA